jgi:hypothetical protein
MMGRMMNPYRVQYFGEEVNTTHAQQPANDWSSRRAPECSEDQALNPGGQAWFDSLPLGLKPELLAQRYPRICNRMAERWSHAGLMTPYFDDLLMDSRGGRQGFPLLIAIEIANLKEFYLDNMAKKKRDVWDRNVGRP